MHPGRPCDKIVMRHDGSARRIRRWEHEPVVERLQKRLDRKPDAMTLRRATIEHVFETLKHCMGSFSLAGCASSPPVTVDNNQPDPTILLVPVQVTTLPWRPAVGHSSTHNAISKAKW